MSGAIVRIRKGKGERITLPVSPETKTKWEEVGKALAEKGCDRHRPGRQADHPEP